jgi:hypothetical protein
MGASVMLLGTGASPNDPVYEMAFTLCARRSEVTRRAP